MVCAHYVPCYILVCCGNESSMTEQEYLSPGKGSQRENMNSKLSQLLSNSIETVSISFVSAFEILTSIFYLPAIPTLTGIVF